MLSTSETIICVATKQFPSHLGNEAAGRVDELVNAVLLRPAPGGSLEVSGSAPHSDAPLPELTDKVVHQIISATERVLQDDQGRCIVQNKKHAYAHVAAAIMSDPNLTSSTSAAHSLGGRMLSAQKIYLSKLCEIQKVAALSDDAIEAENKLHNKLFDPHGFYNTKRSRGEITCFSDEHTHEEHSPEGRAVFDAPSTPLQGVAV